jgi:hypothetical protein
MAAIDVSLIGENGVSICKKIIHYLDPAINGMRDSIFDEVDFDRVYVEHRGRLGLHGASLLLRADLHICVFKLPSVFF